MVYFLGDWGMGDTECVSCQHVPNLQINQQHSQHQHQTLSISRATELIKQRTNSLTHDDHENDDEVALHPLSNQVRKYNFFFARKINLTKPKITSDFIGQFDCDFFNQLFKQIYQINCNQSFVIIFIIR